MNNRQEPHVLVGRLMDRTFLSVEKLSVKKVLVELIDFADGHGLKGKSLSLRTQFLRHFLSLLLVALNELAFLAPQDEGEGPAVMWRWLLYLRIDYLAQILKVEVILIYGVWVLTSAIGAMGLVALAAIVAQRQPSERVKRAFSLVSSVTFHILPVPISSILICDLLGDSHSSSLPIHSRTANPAVSGSCLALLLAFYALHSFSDVQVLCHPKLWAISSKSGLKESFVDAIAVLCDGFFYFQVAPLNPALFYGLSVCLHVSCGAFYTLKLPMYCEVTNLLQVLSHALQCCGSLSVLLSLAVGDMGVSVTLVLLAFPALAAAVQSGWHAYYSHRLQWKLDDCALLLPRCDAFMVFKAAVIAFQERRVIDTFKAMRLNSPKLVHYITAFECCYTLHVGRKESVARIQLARKDTTTPGLLDSFLHHRLWRKLETYSILEEVAYLRCLQGLIKVRETDERLCRDLAEFWGELACEDAKSKKINSLVDRVCVGVMDTKRLYRSLISTSGDNPLLLETYATFLSDVLNRPEKAQKWVTKAKVAREAQQRDYGDSEVHFSQGDAGVIIFSFDPPDIGRVLYFNQTAAVSLHYDAGTFAALRLFALLPPPFASQHVAYCGKLCQRRDLTNLKHPSPLPFFSANGFLIECTAKLAITAVSGPTLLLVAFRVCSTQRELALVSNEGEIYAHTEGLSAVLSLPAKSLAGRSVWECCGAESQRAIVDQRFCIRRAVFGTFCSVQYQSQYVRKLIVSTESSEGLRSPAVSDKCTGRSTSRIPSALDIMKTSSGTDSKSQERRASIRLWSLPPTNLLSVKMKESSARRMLKSFDRRMTLTAIVRENSQLPPSILSGLKRVYFALTCITILVVVLMIAWSMAICIYLVTITDNLVNESVTIDLSQQLVHTVRVAGQVRYIDLMNVDLIPDYVRVGARDAIQESVAVLDSIQASMWERLKDGSSAELEEIYLRRAVSTWEVIGTTPQERPRNLINAMKVFTEHARNLLAIPDSQISILHPSGFFIIQNALGGKLTEALQHSLSFLKDDQKAQIEAHIYQIVSIVVLVLFTLAVALAVSVPALTKLQMIAAKVSNILTKLPVLVCLDNKQRATFRLKTQHGAVLELSTQKLREKELKFVIYKPVWRLSWPIVGFFCACVVLYLLLFFGGIDRLITYVSMLPNTMYLYVLRFSSLIQLWYWSVEAIFMESFWSLRSVLKSPSFQVNPMQEIAALTRQFNTVSRGLIIAAEHGYIPLTTAHQRIMIFASNFSTPVFRHGLRCGSRAYVSDSLLCAKYRGVDAGVYRDCGMVHEAAQEYVNISKSVQDMLLGDFQREVRERAWEINAWLLIWTSGSILCLLFCTLPLLYLSKRHMQRIMALTSFARSSFEDRATGEFSSATDSRK